MRENNRVPSAADRIAEASALVDIALAKLDLEANRFHDAQERTRRILSGYLLRLQVLGAAAAKSSEEASRFDAAYRETVHAVAAACRATEGTDS